MLDALRAHGLYGLHPLHRAVQVLVEIAADHIRVAMGCRIHVLQHRYVRLPDLERGQLFGKRLRGRLHQCAMGGHTDCQGDSPFRAGRLCRRHRAFHCAGVTGDHHLPRRVEVDRNHDFPRGRLGTDSAHGSIVQPQDHGHGADAFRHRRLHAAPAFGNQCNRLAEIDGAGADQCGVFTQAVPGHQRRPGTTVCLPCAPHGDTGSQHGGLGPVCPVELVFRALLDQLPEIVAQRVAGLGEGGRYLRIVRGQRREHADRLGTLSREHHGEIVGCCIHLSLQR